MDKDTIKNKGSNVGDVDYYNDNTKTCGGNQTALIWGQAAIAIGPPIMFNQAPDIFHNGFSYQEKWITNPLIVQPRHWLVIFWEKV